MTSGTDSRVGPDLTRVARSTERISNSSSTSTSSSHGPDHRSPSGPGAPSRWSPDETDRQIRDAPLFAHGRPTRSHLDKLCAEYTVITGDAVPTLKKRQLIAAAYRVHGKNFLPLLRRLFEALGTCTNLLGILRTTEPEAHWERSLLATEHTRSRPVSASSSGAR